MNVGVHVKKWRLLLALVQVLRDTGVDGRCGICAMAIAIWMPCSLGTN